MEKNGSNDILEQKEKDDKEKQELNVCLICLRNGNELIH
jgi:hypothetical protein